MADDEMYEVEITVRRLKQTTREVYGTARTEWEGTMLAQQTVRVMDGRNATAVYVAAGDEVQRVLRDGGVRVAHSSPMSRWVEALAAAAAAEAAEQHD